MCGSYRDDSNACVHYYETNISDIFRWVTSLKYEMSKVHHPLTPDNCEMTSMDQEIKNKHFNGFTGNHSENSAEKLPCVILWLHAINGSGWTADAEYVYVSVYLYHNAWTRRTTTPLIDRVKTDCRVEWNGIRISKTVEQQMFGFYLVVNVGSYLYAEPIKSTMPTKYHRNWIDKFWVDFICTAANQCAGWVDKIALLKAKRYWLVLCHKLLNFVHNKLYLKPNMVLMIAYTCQLLFYGILCIYHYSLPSNPL